MLIVGNECHIEHEPPIRVCEREVKHEGQEVIERKRQGGREEGKRRRR